MFQIRDRIVCHAELLHHESGECVHETTDLAVDLRRGFSKHIIAVGIA
jgi:hypothetical protein